MFEISDVFFFCFVRPTTADLLCEMLMCDKQMYKNEETMKNQKWAVPNIFICVI